MISPLPKIPKQIIEAINNEKLVVFIGAGVSRIIGCKSWKELANNLIKRCFRARKEDETTCINFKEKEVLSKSRNYKKIITICRDILKKNKLEDIFYDELEKSLEAEPELIQSQNIYHEIYGLRGIFITTNADKHFDAKFNPQQVIYKAEDFDAPKISRTKLYHIHGSIADKSTLIFTVPDYINRYNDPKFKNFLETIFNGEYTVLFLAYGLEEFELLDFLISKYDFHGNKELKHFIILPFFRDEINIYEFEEEYYNHMGIGVIPYAQDIRGNNQLYYILKEWNAEVNKVTAYTYDSYKEIEDDVDNYKKENEEKIWQIIKNDKPQEEHFFRALASSSNPFPWLKPLKEKGYFKPENNPSPNEMEDKKGLFVIPYWNILGYLGNTSTINSKNPSDEITKLLMEIIDSIIDYRGNDGERIENNRTDLNIIKIIFKLPSDKICGKYIKFLDTALRSKWDTTLLAADIGKTFIPNLLDRRSKKSLLKLIDVVLRYKKDDIVVLDKYNSIMDKFWLKNALTKHKPQIAKLYGMDAVEIALEKIISIVKEDNSQFNNVWIPTIEDNSQTDFIDRYECQLVYFVRDMLRLSEPKKIKDRISKLMQEKHSIFKRIALDAINFHYKHLNELFWGLSSNPLDEVSLKHELFELINNNALLFSKEQIKKIVEWIEARKYFIPDEIKNQIIKVNKLLAYRKKEWLWAILKTSDKNVKELYEKYNKINSEEIQHPGFNSWFETWVGNASPISEGELLSKSNEEIAKYLLEYKQEKGGGAPSIEGLSDTLRKAVSIKPEKFSHEIEPFLSIPRIYQHAFLGGLYDAWQSNTIFIWEGIFNFALKIVESDDFWKEKYDRLGFNYSNWIVTQIADLIKEGTRKDDHAFDTFLLPQAEKLLLILSDKADSDLPELDDLATAVLNSCRGKIFSAMINYSLRYARLFKKNEQVRWPNNIKKEFDKRLDKEIESSIEFSVTLGEYLPHLLYLDTKWVNDNINNIFSEGNNKHWEAAFIGYLSHSSTLYSSIYFVLRDNGHYNKALETRFKDGHITERLVQHICFGYIEEWEKLNNKKSLIYLLLNKGNFNQISQIVRFFWMHRNKLDEKKKLKVKPLWKALYEILSKKETVKEAQEIISSLSMWVPFIDNIDMESFEWIKLSAKYVQVDFNTPLFIEYILGHVSKTPKLVSEIYLEMLKAGDYPDYEKKHIREIVEKLYEHEQNTNADKICNIYLGQGFDFLKDIYKKHRK